MDFSMLSDRLSRATPIGTNVTYYQLRSSATRCAALYNAPAREEPERTYRECRTLLVTITIKGQEVAIFAIELQVYTTISLTTVFVSKADSTGFLSLLSLPRNTESLLQSVTSVFVSHTIQDLHRPDRRLVVSLFARAQNQYLFPGSIENGLKHVLDDRQLIKWWCKTLNSTLQGYTSERDHDGEAHERAPSCTAGQHSPDCSLASPSGRYSCTSRIDNDRSGLVSAAAYLVVPGLDRYETASFFPPAVRVDSQARETWTADHPLRDISPYHAGTPPRSLIPHFPDDPKSRFMGDLDEECLGLPSTGNQSSQTIYDSPTKRGGGHWKSVKSLEQFWEMMAFRQECSSGRLVGFLWLVFTPAMILNVKDPRASLPAGLFLSKRRRSLEENGERVLGTKKRMKAALGQSKSTGPITSRAPRIKSSGSQPASETRIGFRSAQAELLLPEKSYNRAHDLLLRLDFANLQIAASSTRRWVEEIAVIAGVKDSGWGIEVNGAKEITRKKASPQIGPGVLGQDGNPTITVLSVKKKPKV